VKNTAKLYLSIFVTIISTFYIKAQPNEVMNSSELKMALEKLNVLGSVLYIAAHPDDENTAVLSYFASEKLMRTGYLSLTRGDGGQNLIGSEQAEQLGLIRTQELLSARKLDGAEQFFTRAIDFGYSKSPKETLEIWDKEKILSDVVWVIRKFRPDVIITRFPSTGEGGHGHHTASAILAEEAFKIAGDPTKFPEQLQFVKPWQPKRLYWNAWIPNPEEDKNILSNFISINLGTYNPVLGRSYTEIAAESRSMHKSQGFGSSGRRGETLNYFSYIAGDPAKKDLLDDINISWNRIKGGEKIGEVLTKANKEFNSENPSSILPLLFEAYSHMKKLTGDSWIETKKNDLIQVIQSAAGIWIEAIADDYSAPPGGSINIITGIVNRSNFPFILKKVEATYQTDENILGKKLNNEEFVSSTIRIKLPDDIDYTQPYWLKEVPEHGLYIVNNQQFIGVPDNLPPLTASFFISTGENEIVFKTPVFYRWNDPVDGEKYRPFEIVPKVAVNIMDKVYLFPNNDEKEIYIKLISNIDSASGRLNLILPETWKAEPGEINFSLAKKGDENTFAFRLFPAKNINESAKLTAQVKINGTIISKGMLTINYPHIPTQTLFPDATTKLVRFNTEKIVGSIGYIMGSGDEIPPYLEQLGYKVTLINENTFVNNNLSAFDAIISGVRVYNTKDWVSKFQNKILDYIKSGGIYVVQYNVNRGLVTENIGPYPFNISRGRVTSEDASIIFLKPDHPLLNYPNKISKEDFSGWTQERGLYFADKWDSSYETIIACNDPGEKPQEGGILYLQYGNGVFIYTGYSWFRQLPAGVPGAYRIFVNLISANHNVHGSN